MISSRLTSKKTFSGIMDAYKNSVPMITGDVLEHYYYINECVGVGLGNVLKPFITLLSILPNIEQIRVVPFYGMLGDYDNILDEQHLLNQSELTYAHYKVSFWQFMILKIENEQENLETEMNTDNYIYRIKHPIDNLFNHSINIDLHYNRDLISDEVYERIMKGIFKIKFKKHITDYVDQFIENIEMTNSLALSIRTWKASHEKNVNRLYDKNVYFEKIERMLESYPNITNVIISLDKEDEIGEYLNFFQEKYPNINVITFENDYGELEKSMIKVLVLSKCKYLICNRISSFSDLIFWFGKCQQIVNSVF